MSLITFDETDFDVFTIPGLEARMAAIVGQIRPKLTWLGDQLKPGLSLLCGQEMHPHVAKHARRTVNPPNDTWVAWAHHKRGYKAHPHFQVGLWSTHLFIQFAVIYECGHKEQFAGQLRQQLDRIRQHIPGHYFWSDDHTKPDTVPHVQMKPEDFASLIRKLETTKKAEVLCGLRIDRHDPILSQSEALIQTIEETFHTLLPLYRMAF